MIDHEISNSIEIKRSFNRIKELVKNHESTGPYEINYLAEVITNLSKSYELKIILTMTENLANEGLHVDQIVDQLRILSKKIEPLKENSKSNEAIAENLIIDAITHLNNNKELDHHKAIINNLLNESLFYLRKH